MAVQQCISALIKLEPLIGMAVVLNLAYLGLPEFSFIEGVRKKIKVRLLMMDKRVTELVQDAGWYKTLHDLSRTGSLDEIPFRQQKFWISAPLLWGIPYNVLFNWRIARALSVGATLFAVTLLCLAVGQEIKVTDWHNCTVDELHIGFMYELAVAAMCWPLFVILVGRLVTWGAHAFVRQQTDHFAKGYQNDAEQEVADFIERLEKLDQPKPKPKAKPSTARRAGPRRPAGA